MAEKKTPPARKKTARQANPQRGRSGIKPGAKPAAKPAPKPAPKATARPAAYPPESSGETHPVRLEENLYRIYTRFERFAGDAVGLAILAFALMTLLALPTQLGLAGDTLLAGWAARLRLWFGYGSVIVVIVLALVGLLLLRRKTFELNQISWLKVFALEGSAFSALMILTLWGGATLSQAENGQDGGTIGWGLVELLTMVLRPLGLAGSFWLYLILVPVFAFSTLYGLGLLGALSQVLFKLANMDGAYHPAVLNPEPAISMAPIAEPGPAQAAAAKKKPAGLPVQFRKNFRIEERSEKNSPPPPRDDHLPPLSLLISEQSSRPDERNINLTAGLIEKTLAEFGIPAKVIGFKVGPTVTQFAVEPGFVEKNGGTNLPENGDPASRQKVRVSQIAGLSRDLALALAAERLRIEAPVPGRPYIGIEVPNIRSTIVRLRPVLENEAFYKVNSPLAIALGRDVSGQAIVADLTSMPHLLIAGTTGSGKSVCIAALTACLVMNNTPEELRLVMVDPKMVELVRFNGLPHLYGKVETNIERIMGVLHWTVAEMDRRYRLLEEFHARHIDSYNRKAHRRKGAEILPRIVVMIDELADLMMTAPDQTEPALVRLAQLARATGIHLVVATQRPSTDVVTGLIKANFPARIAFAVASSIDSRVILDTTGAESLLGHGDMLFLAGDAPAPTRTQGVMVTDQEVERVITFWQQSRPSAGSELPPWEETLKAEAVLAEKDGLVEKAIGLVRQEQRATASLLQRRLRIGYPRAARLMDELEELGIIGPSGSGREREVLIGPDDDAGPAQSDEDDY